MSTTTICGLCFDWAYQELPDARNARLVHAIVHDPWHRTKTYPHAWIERVGRVYDWQSVAQGLGPGPRGWPRKRFYDAYAPKEIRTYTFDESRLHAARSGNYGPW